MLEQTSGLIFGQMKIAFNENVGTDFSKKVFMFPGQGSAYQGMYKELFLKYNFIQQRFTLMDSIATQYGFPQVTSYITDENLKPKTAEIIRNLALYTMEISLFELLLKKGIRPDLITAHSFGEYAALTAAGIISFQDMVRIICIRDKITNNFKFDACMLVVRANEETIKKIILETDCSIANINSTQQIALAVPNKSLKTIQTKLKNENIASVKLDVAHPYHSNFMKEPVMQFARELKDLKISITQPTIPIISSVESNYIDANNFKKETILEIIEKQMLEQVNFKRQLELINELKYHNFIEVGPQKTLINLTKETLSSSVIKTRSASEIFFKQDDVTAESGDKTIMSRASGHIFKAFNKALSSVTGYKIESLKIKDRLQEDLGIDSIKKAEIILKVFQDMGAEGHSGAQSIVLSELSTVDDILNYFDREEKTNLNKELKTRKTNPEDFKPLKQTWVELKIEDYLKSLLRPLDVLSKTVTSFDRESSFREDVHRFYKKKDDRAKLVQIFFEPSFELNKEYVINSSEQFKNWVFEFSNFWKDFKITHPWCDQNIHMQFIYQKRDQKLGLMLRSFIKSWSLEQGCLNCKVIQIDDLKSDKIIQDLKYELMSPNTAYIKYENGKRFVQQYIENKQFVEATQKVNATYIVIGGHSGVGARIVDSIDEKTNPNIIIIGRRNEQDSVVKNYLQGLINRGINCEYHCGDVRDFNKMKSIFNHVKTKYKKIDLVVNSSGVVISKVLDKISEDEIVQEVGIKLISVCNLARLAEEIDLPHIINFSSIAGYYGNAGQAAYALGNSAIDIVSSILDKSDGRRFQSILWGAWENTGFTEGQLAKSYIDITGLSYLPPKTGASFFWNMYAANAEEANYAFLDNMSEAVYKGVQIDKKTIRQFFDFPQSPFVGSVFNLKGLTLQNLPYLRDHRLTGQPILAASNMLAIFVQFGYAIWGEIPDVVNFNAHNFIFVPEAESIITLEIDRSESIRAQLKSTLVHSEGIITKPSHNKEIQTIKIPKYKGVLENHSLKNGVIELDDSFDFNTHIMADEKTREIVIELKLSNLPFCTEMPLFDRVYQLVEFACQSLSLTVDWKTGRYLIPKRIGKFELFSSAQITEKVYSVHGNIDIDKKFCNGDTYILNELGEVIIKLSDVQFSFLVEDDEVETRFVFKE